MKDLHNYQVNYAPLLQQKHFKKFGDKASTKQQEMLVVLKGSCSGCPSSQATLKNGVEQLLKDKVGEKIKEVIALNE